MKVSHFMGWSTVLSLAASSAGKTSTLLSFSFQANGTYKITINNEERYNDFCIVFWVTIHLI